MSKRSQDGKKSIGQLMAEGAREALAHKRGDRTGARVTRARVTMRSVDVIPPPEYAHRDVQRIREQLGLLQAVFAELIGASPSTVSAWERGAREPSDMARRLLQLAERQPEVFADDLVETD